MTTNATDNKQQMHYASLELSHKFWINLEKVVLNFSKISLRPPWSIFLISQKLKIIFKSTQIHWKANKIIYNFHVYTESKFKTKKGENYEYFPDLPGRKSVADFDKLVADFGNSVADFELHSSSKIRLTMRFSLRNHS
ncbi:hypothetical protein MTR_7g037575 [Medicago truncatula]|uniref:Uncharacterized protein n=1 Tax=Medicago truncatula TaxID=3880 RepID=A0A072TXQ5_MEDTR|nr:hypothetical protein MTR_7g037575 [Medicago truncatula]